MTKVRVEPSGIEFDALPGETVFAAAERLGYIWPTVCGGQVSCKVCALEVRAGVESLLPMSRLERSGLERSFVNVERNGFPLRLACQAIPAGDIVVFKRGVRAKPPSI